MIAGKSVLFHFPKNIVSFGQQKRGLIEHSERKCLISDSRNSRMAFWKHIEDTSSARKRRFYRITKKGRKELDRQKEEWKEYAGAVGKVLQLQNA